MYTVHCTVAPVMYKIAPSAVTGWSLEGVWSHIGVQNIPKTQFVEDQGQSQKTSQSHIRWSFVAEITVLSRQISYLANFLFGKFLICANDIWPLQLLKQQWRSQNFSTGGAAGGKPC